MKHATGSGDTVLRARNILRRASGVPKREPQTAHRAASGDPASAGPVTRPSRSGRAALQHRRRALASMAPRLGRVLVATRRSAERGARKRAGVRGPAARGGLRARVVWTPALERAGVPYFRSYDLRHTCAMLLLRRPHAQRSRRAPRPRRPRLHRTHLRARDGARARRRPRPLQLLAGRDRSSATALRKANRRGPSTSAPTSFIR